MKRRTLDIVFSFGGLALAGLLLILGLVMANQANFAETYVKDQLGQQKITFTPVVGLTAEEKKATCLVDNAGKALLTGKQAECYANEYIGLHVTEINDGKTYSQTSTEARAKKAEADAAKASGAANAGVLAGESAALTGKTDALFRGETLRGLLLTSYGFSIFGERAGQAGFVAFAAALVLLLASLAGFAHAFTKQADHEILSGK
ncbi:unannotated protein [freshwater metagenome]|uniref:Unannotated protein n=1 Tax=freshwater metagenome TaxID=449393 RepID=A0A6J6YLZ8_9ZZZZ|nr:hypothetical protein [Actinomycetota bacterium]